MENNGNSQEIMIVSVSLPRSMVLSIRKIADSKMSNFSQVFREAAMLGLEQMK